MIFVDTGGWFASVVPWDGAHLQAAAWLAQNRERLVTTDYILDETLTLLRTKNEPVLALQLGKQLIQDTIATLVYLSEDQIKSAWLVFQQFHDKGWSFTDCTSKVFMEEYEISQAFSFDQHFRQFGSVTVVPPIES